MSGVTGADEFPTQNMRNDNRDGDRLTTFRHDGERHGVEYEDVDVKMGSIKLAKRQDVFLEKISRERSPPRGMKKRGIQS